MPPLRIAVALGLVLGWPGLAAAQSGGPADAASPAVPADDGRRAMPYGNSADDRSSLDEAAARLRSSEETSFGSHVGRIGNPSGNSDVAASQAPANLTAPPVAGNPSSASSPTASPPHAGDRLPISPPHRVRLGEPDSRTGGPMSLLSIGSSLAVVLGLFLLVAWGVKRAMPGRSGLLPSEVVEVLGRASLGARQQVHLVRCGSKLLLVSATPGGMETLTEIAEPDEVQRLAALCRQTQPGSTTAAFRQVFQQLATGAGHDA